MIDKNEFYETLSNISKLNVQFHRAVNQFRYYSVNNSGLALLSYFGIDYKKTGEG